MNAYEQKQAARKARFYFLAQAASAELDKISGGKRAADYEACLVEAFNDVLGGRSVKEFDSFDDYWAEFDAAFWYDSQDSGEDTLDAYEHIKSLFIKAVEAAGGC